jgi:membrane protein implicated in regulation of membrane protease activity
LQKREKQSVRTFCAYRLAKKVFCPKMWYITNNGGFVMDSATFWWIAAAALVIAELLTGTIYLLAVATGAVAGALAAHLGAGLALQIAVAAAVGTATTLLWHLSKMRQRRSQVAPATSNADVNQDIGAQVWVEAWNADATAQVKYRGAQWSVIAAAGVAQQTGLHRVTQVVGNRLVVAPV